jgi:glycosyltransferase involved in cell wall biosynthesis
MMQSTSTLGGKLLVVAAAFPETGGARVDKLVKLLPRFGVEPIVLSAAENHTADAARLLADLYPPDLEAHRAKSLGPAPFSVPYLVRGPEARWYRLLRLLSFPERCVLLPDYMVRWIPGGIRMAGRLARQGRIAAVLTSSPPESTHLIGYYLQRRHGVPWVADFRDLWTEKTLLCRPATPLHARAIRRLERRVFAAADHVIANTPENRARYQTRFGLEDARVTVIPNGFDRDDLIGERRPPRDGICRVGYMGHLDKHGFPWKVFLLALKTLANDADHPQVRLVHCGFQSREVREFLAAEGIEHLVEARGTLEHSAALRVMAETDLLLCLLYENEYSDAIVNTKIYPYLMMHRPILTIGPERGAVARIVTATRTGTVVSASRGADAIAEVLRTYHRAWRAAPLRVDPDEREVARYDLLRHAESVATIVASLQERRQAATATVACPSPPPSALPT